MKTRSALLLLGLLCLTVPLWAADWPQWRGPQRDAVSMEKGLLSSWPKDGPPLLWTFEKTGLGLSSPAVVGNKLYTMGARDGITYVLCLSVDKGAEVWSSKVGPMFDFQGNTWGTGPRSTPTVDGDRVYALGGFGDLVCLKASDGKQVWKLNLKEDLGGEMMSRWGYSESVLIDGDRLICTPGGEQGALAALDKMTGKVIWRSKEVKDKSTYASIMPAAIGGVKQYIALTYNDGEAGCGTVGVAAENGKLLWNHRQDPNTRTDIVALTPLVKDNEVYVVKEENGGTQLLKVTGKGNDFQVKELYRRPAQKNMKNAHGGVLRMGGHVYGHSDRRGWMCQDWKTGKIVWAEEFKLEVRAGGSLIAADEHLYLYTDQGTAALIQASPEGWQESGRFTIPRRWTAPAELRGKFSGAGVWTHPVIANGRLYLRDQEYLFCFDVREKK